MGESLINIKRRISSTKSTSKITQAMQMVSGSKLNQIEKKSINYQVYSKKIREVIQHLSMSKLLKKSNFEMYGNTITNDMLQQRPIHKTGYLIITSDRGLVGSYNSTVIRESMKIINNHENNKCTFMVLGQKGVDFFKSHGMKLSYEYVGVKDIPSYSEVQSIVTTIVRMYNNKEFDELYVCYNHHVNTLTSKFCSEKMLPINDLYKNKTLKNKYEEYIIEPSLDIVLDVILPQYARSLIYGAILDAKTAEHAASMTAMKAATDNANNLISDLTLQYNRARQAAITTEISEIVGGANALTQS